jgi:pimeloyl-ACP methyl ester carboxylesterase
MPDQPHVGSRHATYDACMTRRELRAGVDGGDLVGWVRGDGPPVLLLHGGPGLSFDYLDSLDDEIGPGRTVAGFQQRGLAPSTVSGPFDVAAQVEDVRHVLDTLGWDRATVLGHSWGGHLAIHVAAALPDRLDGVLVVDPLGVVGDGGAKEFEDALFARTPEDVRQRAREIDQRAMAGDRTDDDVIEGLRLVWPGYFPTWSSAPPMPPMRASVEAYSETFAALQVELPRLEAALGTIRVPIGFVHGAVSPMPVTASTDAADRITQAWVEIVPGAGHFPWLDAPGSVAAALSRLSP